MTDASIGSRSTSCPAGPLRPLLELPGVTDVLVHGPREVLIDRGHGLEETDVVFPDDAAVRRLAQRLAIAAGRRLDAATPYVDAHLPDGIRFHAMLAPVSTRGTTIALRSGGAGPRSLDELVDAGMLPPEGGELLARVVRARLPFLITGGAGSGKTTLLAALLGIVPPTERIVIVEDVRELNPAHPHVVQMEARPPNVEGAGRITMSTLVRQALRMRPDRIVVGEARGPEVLDLLAALNTGHEGGCGTVHANAAAELPARVEALAAEAGIGRAAVHSRLAAAVAIVVHLVRGDDGARRVAEVAGLTIGPDGLVVVRPVARIDRCRPGSAGPGSLGRGPAGGGLVDAGGLSELCARLTDRGAG